MLEIPSGNSWAAAAPCTQWCGARPGGPRGRGAAPEPPGTLPGPARASRRPCCRRRARPWRPPPRAPGRPLAGQAAALWVATLCQRPGAQDRGAERAPRLCGGVGRAQKVPAVILLKHLVARLGEVLDPFCAWQRHHKGHPMQARPCMWPCKAGDVLPGPSAHIPSTTARALPWVQPHCSRKPLELIALAAASATRWACAQARQYAA